MTKTPIQTLAYAISDVGNWTWINIQEASLVQLEFGNAMVNMNTPEDGKPPSHRLALVFRDPVSVTVLYHKDAQLPADWLKLFNQDQLEPFSIDYDNFSFEKEKIKAILSGADRTEVILGGRYADHAENSCQLGFWTEEIGIVIVADSMDIYSHTGEITLDEIVTYHQAWWDYWKKYWDVKDTPEALPYDALCEITIPVK